MSAQHTNKPTLPCTSSTHNIAWYVEHQGLFTWESGSYLILVCGFWDLFGKERKKSGFTTLAWYLTNKQQSFVI